MLCDDFLAKIDTYIDGDMPEGEQSDFLEHAKNCESCKAALLAAEEIITESRKLAEAKAPADLLPFVMNEVRNESARRKRHWPLGARIGAGVAACVLVCVVIVAAATGGLGVGAGTANNAVPNAPGYANESSRVYGGTSAYDSGETGNYDYEYSEKLMATTDMAAPMATSMPASGAALSTGGEAVSEEFGQKIITNGNIYITSYSFDDDARLIEEIISSAGGYAQSSSVSGTPLEPGSYYGGRHGYYTFRIPSGMYKSVAERLKEIGVLESYSEYSDDITSQYYDTQARLESYKLQYDTIEKLLSKAEKIEDIMIIQAELRDIMYMIESLTGTIKQWDFLTSYSTLDISISETADPSTVTGVDPTLGGRMKEGFVGSVNSLITAGENLVVWLSGAIMPLIVLGAIATAVCLIIRRRRKIK